MAKPASATRWSNAQPTATSAVSAATQTSEKPTLEADAARLVMYGAGMADLVGEGKLTRLLLRAQTGGRVGSSTGRIAAA